MAHRQASRAVVGAGIGLCGAVLAVLKLTRDEVLSLTADPTTTADLPPWTGVFSTLGVIGWAASVGVCALAAVVLHARRSSSTSFFVATAALLSYLALDDAYLLHEYVGPEVLHVPQSVVVAALGAAVAVWAWRFRRRLAESDLLVLGIAGLALAGSVVVDATGRYGLIIVEDWLKLSGIAALFAWSLTAAESALEARPAGL
jgi:hypothetical protein